MTRMSGAELRTEVRGAVGEEAGRTEEPLCGLEPGPEGFTLHLPPIGPSRPDKESRRLTCLPRLTGFLVNPAPARPHDYRGSSLGCREEDRDPVAGGLSHRGLRHSQVFLSLCLSFPSDSKV